MTFLQKYQKQVLGAAALTLAVGSLIAFVPYSVSAQDGDTPGNLSEYEIIEAHEADFAEMDLFGYISDEALIANALDITEEELDAASKKALDSALNQAVADGELTQTQADDLKADEYAYFMLPHFAALENINQYLAEALDISQTELETALDGAIQKATDDGLITQAQANDMLLNKLIEARMDEAYQKALDEAVGLGLVTQAQVDEMKGGTIHAAGTTGVVHMAEPLSDLEAAELGIDLDAFVVDVDELAEGAFEFSDEDGVVFEFEGEFEDLEDIESFEFFGMPADIVGGLSFLPDVNPYR